MLKLDSANREYWLVVLIGGCSWLTHCSPAPATPSVRPPAASVQVTQVAQAGSAPAPTPKVPSVRKPTSLPAAKCQVQLTSSSVADFVVLRAAGVPFAAISGGFDKAEILLGEGDVGGTATFESLGLHVTGEVRLSDLVFFAKKPKLQDGWLEVKLGHPKSVTSGAVLAPLALPTNVSSATALTEVRFTCDEIALTPPYRNRTQLGHEAGFKEGTSSSLRSAVDGEVVAQISIPVVDHKAPVRPQRQPFDGPYPLVVALETRGTQAKVRVEGPESIVEGWVDRSILSKPTTSMTYSTPGFGYDGGDFRCPSEVPVYIRVGEDVVEVGYFERDRGIALVDMHDDGSAPTERAEVRVDLGLNPFGGIGARWPSKHLVPFVRGSKLEGCKRR